MPQRSPRLKGALTIFDHPEVQKYNMPDNRNIQPVKGVLFTSAKSGQGKWLLHNFKTDLRL